jgi:hypothetical protein
MLDALARIVRNARPSSTWCRCAQPRRFDDDEHAFCWRCGRPIEGVDEEGVGLDRAEDEDWDE